LRSIPSGAFRRSNCRRHKPSAALEAQALSQASAVAAKLVPKEARRQAAAERRAELTLLVEDYGGEITFCPPEMTTAQLKKRKTENENGPAADLR